MDNPKHDRASSTTSVICPWCGHEDPEVFEYKRGDYFCESCSREFHVEVNEVQTWATTPNVYAEQARHDYPWVAEQVEADIARQRGR